MDYKGPERREDPFCPSHNKHLEAFDAQREKHAKLAGWQKAQAFFIALCFGSVVLFVGKTTESVTEMSKSIAKTDKQIAVIITAMRNKNDKQDDINTRFDNRISANEQDIHVLQLHAQRVDDKMGFK